MKPTLLLLMFIASAQLLAADGGSVGHLALGRVFLFRLPDGQYSYYLSEAGTGLSSDSLLPKFATIEALCHNLHERARVERQFGRPPSAIDVSEAPQSPVDGVSVFPVVGADRERLSEFARSLAFDDLLVFEKAVGHAPDAPSSPDHP